MKLTQVQRKALRIAIVELSEEGPNDKTMGICWNLDNMVVQGAKFIDTYAFVSHNCVDWPDITGEVGVDEADGVRTCCYPVKREYDGSAARLPLWEGGQYAQRMSLLRYLLTKVA